MWEGVAASRDFRGRGPGGLMSVSRDFRGRLSGESHGRRHASVLESWGSPVGDGRHYLVAQEQGSYRTSPFAGDGQGAA